MHFLITTTDFDMGGITTSIKNLTDELIFRGHRVSILNLTEIREFPVEFNSEIKWINLSGLAQKWNINMDTYRQSCGLRKILLLIVGIIKKIFTKLKIWNPLIFCRMKKIHCDIAITERLGETCSYVINNKTDATATIAFIHGRFDLNCSSWLFTLKEIDHIACVSDDWSKGFRKKFPQYANKVCTVYNLFDDKLIKQMAEEKRYFIEKKAFKIVTVSRLEISQKKIDIIPDICKIIRKVCPNMDFCWYIIGDGVDRELIKKRINETGMENFISLLGSKKNPYPYIKNADLFVLTSSWESYGMVVQEALILGTPVVAGEYGALKEIIKDPREGIIAKNSVEGIADAILELMNNPKRYVEMKEYLKHYKYSPDVAYNQLMKICQ